MKINLLILNSLMASAIAVPPGSPIIHEKRDANSQWIKREAVDPNTSVPVRIALKQNNLEKGMDYLLDVSHPDSSNYGKHYSADQVVDLFAPSDESIDAVKAWLVKSGVPANSITTSKGKGWLNFVATSGQLEALLHTSFSTYDHVEARDVHIGTDAYSLPEDISQHVDFVIPGVVFAPVKASKKAKRGDVPFRRLSKPVPAHIAQLVAANPLDTSSCDTVITPPCIKAIYNITDGTSSIPTNALGVFEISFFGAYSQEDLTQYWEMFAPNIPPTTGPKVDAFDNATAPSTPSQSDLESDMDFEIAIPLIYPQTTVLFQAPFDGLSIYTQFLDAIDGSYCTFSDHGITGDDPEIDPLGDNDCGVFNPTNVISFSFAASEADYPTNYLQRQCDEFMKLGLQGVSIVYASGDDGVARRTGSCLGPDKNIFTPNQPASCPYVTSVGATTLPPGSQPGDEETAVTSFSSGGGFSNIWPSPSYQADAVASYFASHDPGYPSYNTSDGVIPTTGGIYNRAGRGYPDVSALGDNLIIITQGAQAMSGGTSMATPVFASILTRVNEERIIAGKSVVGFVNPALYANPAMFHDVTVGNQDKGGENGDSKPSECGNTGFSAVTGWDPVTGLGTPNYPAILEYFLSLP